MAAFYSPWHDAEQRAALAAGFARRGEDYDQSAFEVAAFASVVVDDDVERAADTLRPGVALYVGGMGARERNFHFDAVARMGFEEAATTVRDLYLDGRRAEAVAAVPTALVEKLNLIGPAAKIREELSEWKRSAVSLLIARGERSSLRLLPDLVG